MKNINGVFKFLFRNRLYFPNLNPPDEITFKNIASLLISNGLRTTLGLLFGLFIIFIIFFPFIIYYYPNGISGEKPNFPLIFLFSIFILYFISSIIYTIVMSWKWYLKYLNQKKQ